MRSNKGVLLFALVVLGVTQTNCDGNSPTTKEELAARLVAGANYDMAISDLEGVNQQIMTACGISEGTSIAGTETAVGPMPPQDPNLPHILSEIEQATTTFIHFDANSYQINVMIAGLVVPFDQGSWQAIDENTIEMINATGSLQADVTIGGNTLHITANAEQPNLDCSTSFGFGDVSDPLLPSGDGSGIPIEATPDVTPTLGETAQALQGTWCYYTGSPYYLALNVEGTTIEGAYYFDNEDEGVFDNPLTFNTITSSINEETESATVALTDDTEVGLSDWNDPAPLLFNGTTKDYIKIKYKSGVIGFFKRSTSENPRECPDQATDILLSF